MRLSDCVTFRRVVLVDGLTAEEMKKCVWVKPQLVAQIEFLEWTEADHLRHSKFVLNGAALSYYKGIVITAERSAPAEM